MCIRDRLSKIKPYTFTLFIQRYGEEELLNCLEENEKNGIVYHRNGISGDYDDFDEPEELIDYILSGTRLEEALACLSESESPTCSL